MLLLLLCELFGIDSNALRHIVGFVDAHQAVRQLEHIVPEAFFRGGGLREGQQCDAGRHVIIRVDNVGLCLKVFLFC